MTSQKRYRHHQDNNNNSSRFRDLPPRFKRQKSSTSPPPSSPKTSTTPVSESQSSSQLNTTTQKSDSPHSTTSVSPMAPSPGLVGERPVGHARSRMTLLQNPQTAASSTAAWQWSPRTDDVAVLSPVDNRYYNISNGPHSPRINHVPLGTHFGYATNSPPMSPWATGGLKNLPGQPSTFQNPTWSPVQSDPFRSQVQSPPSFMSNNENLVPSQVTSCSPWGKQEFQPQPQSSCSPPVQNQNSSKPTETINSNQQVRRKNDAKSKADISDPDIRTIEMLRELERVADEKECETDDVGVDRKSLVSHHLRMLMCAVDKYIEDDMTLNSRDDEVIPTTESAASSPVPSPGPGKMWPHEHPKETKLENNLQLDAALWAQHSNSSHVNKSVAQLAVPTHAGQNRVCSRSPGVQMPHAPQISLLQAEQRRPQNPEAPAWDLWSSPSFDFCGVLTNQGPAGASPFTLFGNAGELNCGNKQRERKPLYQR